MRVCSITQGSFGNVHRALTQNVKLLCWRLPCCYRHFAHIADSLPMTLRALRSVQAAGRNAPRLAIQAESRHMQAFLSFLWTHDCAAQRRMVLCHCI